MMEGFYYEQARQSYRGTWHPGVDQGIKTKISQQLKVHNTYNRLAQLQEKEKEVFVASHLPHLRPHC